MLSIHLLQPRHTLSDPTLEEPLRGSAAMRRFTGIGLGREPAPDETTLCKFRHPPETRGLAARLFKVVGRHVAVGSESYLAAIGRGDVRQRMGSSPVIRPKVLC